jgi:hypothetical protein
MNSTLIPNNSINTNSTSLYLAVFILFWLRCLFTACVFSYAPRWYRNMTFLIDLLTRKILNTICHAYIYPAFHKLRAAFVLCPLFDVAAMLTMCSIINNSMAQKLYTYKWFQINTEGYNSVYRILQIIVTEAKQLQPQYSALKTHAYSWCRSYNAHHDLSSHCVK